MNAGEPATQPSATPGAASHPGPNAPVDTYKAASLSPLKLSLAPEIGLQRAATRLGSITTEARAKLGWAGDGTMHGLKMGTLIGAGMGLISALASNPAFGIVMMVLSPVMGLLFGAVAERAAYRSAQDNFGAQLVTAAGELRDAAFEAGLSLKDLAAQPQLAAAEQLLRKMEESSVKENLKEAMRRVGGPALLHMQQSLAQAKQKLAAARAQQTHKAAE